MKDLPPGSLTLVPDGRLAALHREAVPQKDQLCGAFWGSLALSAAGYPVGQDEVALHAGTALAEGDPADWLPPGAAPRTDYTRTLPVEPEEKLSGTSASGLARAVADLSGGALEVIPIAGEWTARSVIHLLEICAAMPLCMLIANLRTGGLWASRQPVPLFLDHLRGLEVEAADPDWNCGHFVSLAGSLHGPGGTLVLIRDTYPQLGWGGYHLQPATAVAAALNRGDGSEGGVLCVCETPASETLSGRLEGAGFDLRHWDNGTPDHGKERG